MNILQEADVEVRNKIIRKIMVYANTWKVSLVSKAFRFNWLYLTVKTPDSLSAAISYYFNEDNIPHTTQYALFVQNRKETFKALVDGYVRATSESNSNNKSKIMLPIKSINHFVRLGDIELDNEVINLCSYSGSYSLALLLKDYGVLNQSIDRLMFYAMVRASRKDVYDIMALYSTPMHLKILRLAVCLKDLQLFVLCLMRVKLSDIKFAEIINDAIIYAATNILSWILKHSHALNSSFKVLDTVGVIKPEIYEVLKSSPSVDLSAYTLTVK